MEETLISSIKREYLEDFGLEIKLICDEKRANKEPIPIALYEVKKELGIQKGVVVVAEVIAGVDKLEEKIALSKKHEAFRWLSHEEVETFNDGDTVEDFKDSMKKVFELWDVLFKE